MQIRRAHSRENATEVDKKLDHPLVPDLAVIGLPPEADKRLAVVRKLDRSLASLAIFRALGETYLHWKVNREPADHVFALAFHSQWISAQLHDLRLVIAVLFE